MCIHKHYSVDAWREFAAENKGILEVFIIEFKILNNHVFKNVSFMRSDIILLIVLYIS